MSRKTVLQKTSRPRLICASLFSLLLLACSDEQASLNGSSGTAAEEVQGASTREPEGLTINGAYLRQPAPGQTMLAAFATFKNDSTEAFVLNHASSPRASAVEVHRTMYNEGVMSMRHVHHLVVPPKTELVFKPGGYHLMLSGVEGELKPGDRVPLRFDFEGGATVSTEAEVRPIR